MCRVGGVLLMKYGTLELTKDELGEIVRVNGKGRFELVLERYEDGGNVSSHPDWVRTVNGSSIDWLLPNRIYWPVEWNEALCAFATLCHGTQKCNLASILRRGLLPGGRNHSDKAYANARTEIHLSGYDSYDPRCKAGIHFNAPLLIHLGMAAVTTCTCLWFAQNSFV